MKVKELVNFYKDDDGNIHVHIEKMGADEIQKIKKFISLKLITIK